MPASGKSSNRHYEYNRGWNGSGHGPYANAGRSDRASCEELKSRSVTSIPKQSLLWKILNRKGK